MNVIEHVTTICVYPVGFCQAQRFVFACDGHDIATEPLVTVPVYCVLHSGFVLQKLVQVAVSCLCRTSNPRKMYIHGARKQMILHWVSLLTNVILYANLSSHNRFFQFLGALF